MVTLITTPQGPTWLGLTLYITPPAGYTYPYDYYYEDDGEDKGPIRQANRAQQQQLKGPSALLSEPAAVQPPNPRVPLNDDGDEVAALKPRAGSAGTKSSSSMSTNVNTTDMRATSNSSAAGGIDRQQQQQQPGGVLSSSLRKAAFGGDEVDGLRQAITASWREAVAGPSTAAGAEGKGAGSSGTTAAASSRSGRGTRGGKAGGTEASGRRGAGAGAGTKGLRSGNSTATGMGGNGSYGGGTRNGTSAGFRNATRNSTAEAMFPRPTGPAVSVAR